MELTPRKREILRAIIHDYTQSAVPVGSRTLSRKYISSVSPATIRNEMSDLTELGLLLQPHTSAGRIPSEAAYRLYVDELMAHETLSAETVEQIKQYINRHMDEIEQVARSAAHVVSTLTHYTALVMAPQLRRTTLKRIQLVYLYEGSALVVIVTNAGVVKDTIINVPSSLDEKDLSVISKMLTERFEGHSLTDINVSLLPELLQRFGEQRAFFNTLIAALEDSVLQPSMANLVMDGTVNMFDYPEYQDINKASMFLSAMQSHESLYRMLAKRTKRDYTITIGSENNDPVLKDCSVVTATYRMGQRPMGSISVIGPVRMNYPRVMSVLDYMRDHIGEVFIETNHMNKR